MKVIIRWFVENPVAANLLMIVILLGGITSIPKTSKEFFPSAPSNVIEVSVAYPGAGPKEAEEQICIRIEEAIHDLDGIEKIRSNARLGSGQTLIDIEADYDSEKLLNEIKARVDALNTLPSEAERPFVRLATWRREVLSLALTGDVPERSLKIYGEKLRDELAALPEVSYVELGATRDYEIAIDVSEHTLKRYNLSFDEIATAIRQSSLNLPAGSIKADTGDIQLQTRDQAYTQAEFADIIIRRQIDGGQLRLGDIATISDDFVDSNRISRFNGKPAVFLNVSSTAQPDVIKTSNAVKAFVERANQQLPDKLELQLWRDNSYSFRLRLETLINNGTGGLLLVFIVLVLFLRPALALWVSVGIGISFMGALWLLPYVGTSLNMISLFAFLLILGIVVDDAIIVGESIYAEQQAGIKGNAASILGGQKVSKPIIYAVISTMIVFVPMFFLPGDTAHAATAIPTVVVLTLGFSLIESLFILPAHLSHLKPEKPVPETGLRYAPLRILNRLRHYFASGLQLSAYRIYKPLLTKALNWHWLSIAAFVTALMLVISIFASGWLRMSFLPNVASDYIRATATLPEGSPLADAEEVLHTLENAALVLKERHSYIDELNGEKHYYLSNLQAKVDANTIRVIIEIDRDKRAKISTRDLSEQWSELIGEIPKLEELELNYSVGRSGKALQFILASSDNAQLNKASIDLQEQLSRYPGIYNISDSMQAPRPEIELKLKPEAQHLSLSLSDLARQVRQGFYGAEVQRVPRDKEDIKVMLRYNKEERESLSHLETIRIRTQNGEELPFSAVAEIAYVPSYLQIQRIDRQRTITVSAEALKHGSDTNQVTEDLINNHFPRWKQQYPELSISLEGEQLERREFNTAFMFGALKALLVIYIIMAIAFHSYWQPVIILTAVPFGFMGAILGHMLLGKDISIFSFLGILACAGVVVNDNLVLIDRINQLRNQKMNLKAALIQAGADRFRPIILTSLTTFIGLIPIMLETSLQAQFLIPMVISLAFGVVFATGVTLILVPCLFLVGESTKRRFSTTKISF
jgi:multidrug efflux pump subunit AcrB